MLTLARTRTSRPRILLVDDDADIVRAFKLGLELRGFSVDSYTDPMQALDSVEPGSYDLALLDIQMPGIDGFELYKLLRTRDGGVGVVFLTAFEMRESEYGRLAPDPALRGLLKKPLSISQLAEALEARLERP